MKKTLILLSPLAALAMGTAIPATQASASEQVDYSRAFLLPYNVTGQAVLATHFEDAPDLDNSTVFPVDRDYGQIEVDGTIRDAVRDNSGASSLIHYEGSDGTSYHDTLNYLNELESVSESSLSMDVIYAETYYDPWDYIDVDDFSGTSLSSNKAELLLTAYFGLEFPVVSASVVPNESMPGLVDSVEFTCGVRPDGFETDGNGTIVVGESTLEVSLSFAFYEESFDRLAPGDEDNPALEAAFASLGTNYTVYVTENDYAISQAYYYVGDSLLIHHDAYLPYPVEGDTFVTPYGTGTRTYEYSLSRGWERVGSGDAVASLLPLFPKMSPALFHDEGNGTYSVLDNGLSLLSRDLVPSEFGASGAEPYYAYARLNGDALSEFSIGFYDYMYGPYAITASYAGIGTTEFPTWFVEP